MKIGIFKICTVGKKKTVIIDNNQSTYFKDCLNKLCIT